MAHIAAAHNPGQPKTSAIVHAPGSNASCQAMRAGRAISS